MSLVQNMIYQDARRQLRTGTLLSFISMVFILGMVTVNPSSFIISVVYAAIFAITGAALLKGGYADLQKSKTVLDFESDRTQDLLTRVPARMYMGQKALKSFQAGLFDMEGESYGEIQEKIQWKHKILTMFTAMFSYDQLRPAVYTFKNQRGQSLYQIEKKGGFQWRGYIQRKDGGYVAYTKQTKNKGTGQRITRYIEMDQCRWSAEGDDFIGHYKIKDHEGRVWAVIKRGAIPREAAERFEKMPGYLVEWNIRDNIPASLLAFLFLLQSKER
ncbi:hypothetical protein GLW00_04270 [Halobacillus litoralis]|uniref:Uncharacterized protein n=1 Tax=Halobacillus litoralis TaxID=45668 RepID=A0A845F876_9BACI|nr:hypothetical protein [Halobacillus litoralis]MYL70051.1 hypothetical protein [Halobacillus litoralis]